ncbi:NADPH-dependent oxidoreductase [Actinomadura darangshiensis]|uniref:NADPH-dependent oxidoreductase n=1 Tax=Actinomadura darangshiensis TaxID=705336 RepID=A0A4R5C0A0_9ACTN|nr:NAD(P)H-dependent oxidoreductase [Actinomadura darangshiensis]TDD92971.1 NADPH-dependent oxidoreductase [Actinomadura darangshiensis]
MSVLALVGNPRPESRTLQIALQAAEAVAGRIGRAAEPDAVDLSALAPVLLGAEPAAGVRDALDRVTRADVLVVASPTYKATYTGLLKVFLDRLPGGALTSAVALPLLVMGDPKHSLAVEVHLRPLLVELGATVPTPGLAFLEAQVPDAAGVLGAWADLVAPQVSAALAGSTAGAR